MLHRMHPREGVYALIHIFLVAMKGATFHYGEKKKVLFRCFFIMNIFKTCSSYRSYILCVALDVPN